MTRVFARGRRARRSCRLCETASSTWTGGGAAPRHAALRLQRGGGAARRTTPTTARSRPFPTACATRSRPTADRRAAAAAAALGRRRRHRLRRRAAGRAAGRVPARAHRVLGSGQDRRRSWPRGSRRGIGEFNAESEDEIERLAVAGRRAHGGRAGHAAREPGHRRPARIPTSRPACARTSSASTSREAPGHPARLRALRGHRDRRRAVPHRLADHRPRRRWRRRRASWPRCRAA